MKKAALIALVIILLGLLLPQRYTMPVEGATAKDYNANSFWYYPWGKSVTHKGVDIFAKEGTRVFSATSGLVVFAGQIEMGGKVVFVLGPKWRLHYYAHLQDIKTSTFAWATHGETIGTVGTSGNAVGKSPHLHYAIKTLVPYPWKMDKDRQGWRKMFYLNPIDYLSAQSR
ncbi:MAG: peptidoglycan DD-metalloendopeptidase family protein [Bacteroidetes bacterium]|nr:peptidoglycan DD-metalloendopeptidase family protein [Bacteroidota bacterium]